MADDAHAAEGASDTPPPERAVRAFDRWQGRHDLVGFPVAVIRKYADDRGSAFAALATHYAFLGLFPLLVLGLTVLDRVVAARPDLQQRLLDTAVAQLPVIGERVLRQASPLSVDGPVWVLAVAGLLWSATGMYNAAQLAFSQVWNVEGVDRPGLVQRLLRALALYLTMAAGLVVTTAAWYVGLVQPGGAAGTSSRILVAIVLDAAVIAVGLRIVTPGVVTWRRLLAPAVGAGVVWEALQLLAGWLITDRLDRLDDLYGAFALVLVTLGWLNLAARAAVLCVEASVVANEGLWPRRIAQPPLTDADRRVLARLARNERRRPEMRIDVGWQDVERQDVAEQHEQQEQR